MDSIQIGKTKKRQNMAIFKCKMCGGTLEITEESTVYECEYCGSRQTVPTADDEKKMTLFNRANRLRAACEFDKAAGVYESIAAEFPEEAEAFWGIILCRYGIEYVDDPATAKKVPTCHRSSFDSIFDDADFDMVLENADPASRGVYREEAKAIEKLRTSIIEVSAKEEPYDIFICYKETDELGQRTLDSVIAQDVYDALTAKGYKVFFSRISLEDKLGQEYEPYIFAALNSAKIMLAFGTDYEYFNAVWVKNEWSRYLALIAKGDKKTLIPCYKGIDAYDMPKEFAKLQAQDMGKVGATQDLMRGIEKIIGNKHDKKSESQSMIPGITANPSIGSYLKRVQLFLEEKNWEKANEYCEKVLDIDPENGSAYIGKLLISLGAQSISQLSAQPKCLEESQAYTNAIRFASEEDKKRLEAANKAIKSKIADTENRMKHARIVLGIDHDPDSAEKIAKKCEQISNEIEKLQVALKKEKETLLVIENDENSLKEEKRGLESREVQTLVEPIEKEQNRLKQELSTLGLFSGTRKNELRSEIERLSGEIEVIRTDRNEKLEADLAEITAKSEAKRYNIHKTIEEIKNKIAVETVNLNKVKTGGFGHYIQTNAEKLEPIEWDILEVTDSAALILSKKALDCELYNSEEGSVSWEMCTLRKWLNTIFLQNAFSADEQTKIVTTRITTGCSPEDDAGKDHYTEDKIFILSIAEVEKYYHSKESRRCDATEYANSKGASKSKNGSCLWWLRSINRNNSNEEAFAIDSEGEFTSISVCNAVSGYDNQTDINDCAVLRRRVEKGTILTEDLLEDPAIFPDLVDVGLLNLDNCLSIQQALGKTLKTSLDSLSPITDDVIMKGISNCAVRPALWVSLKERNR